MTLSRAAATDTKGTTSKKAMIDTSKKATIDTNGTTSKKATTIKKTETTETKKKKQFKKWGQKKETPPEDDSLRIFYTSLLKQNKNSLMALKWCLEHGLLTDKKSTYAASLLGLEKLTIK